MVDFKSQLDAEQWVEIISKGMSNIAEALEKLSDVMVQFMGFLEAKQPDLEYKTIHEDQNTKTVEKVKNVGILQRILVKKETEKAMLIDRGDGYEAWIPKKAIATKSLNEKNVGKISIEEWFIDKIEWKEGK